MKTFKQFLNEASSEINKVNKILLDYTNGNIPDNYENLQPTVRELFQQIYDLMNDNGINLVILDNGKKFTGQNIVINTEKEIHFELASETEENKIPYKLHVEIKKKDDEGFFFSFLKVEPK